MVPGGIKISGGQVSLSPSQYSARSQTPEAGLHSAVDLMSVGQLLLIPSQNSVRSQSPTGARHAVLAGRRASAGQVLLIPSQYSARSQTPEAGLHSLVDLASGGQSLFTPSQ